MRLPFAALLLMLTTQAAQAELIMCNRTKEAVQVAVAEDEIDKDAVVVKGWTRIAPGACIEVADNFIYDYAFFAYQSGGGRIWEDNARGARFCLRTARDFRIQYDDPGLEYERLGEFECPAGAVKRGFVVLTNDPEEEVRYELK